MTDQEAEQAQKWHGMDGGTAYHLIDRHAADWDEIAAMMRAWYRANALPEIADERNYAAEDEREACARMLELRDSELLLMAGEMTAQELRTVKAVLAQLADAIRMRSNDRNHRPPVGGPVD